MRVGDMVEVVEEPWTVYSGEHVIITKIDEDGKGFDFMIPECRGHAPAHFIRRYLGNFDVDKLRLKD